MAKLKDDPAVQALIAKVAAANAKIEAKAMKAQAKKVTSMIKGMVTAHTDMCEDKATRRALKALGADLLLAVKEA